jgi:hypothetical protein
MPFSVDPKRPLDAPSRLALVRAKVERAKKNLADMEDHLAEFYRGVRVSVKDPDPTHVFVNEAEPIRTSFDALCAAGDVVNNLRSALDHLVFQLIDVHSPNAAPEVFERCAFPICKNQAAYEKGKRQGRLEGMSPSAIRLIDTSKPYKGGNDALWILNELNNICKHRLILTVGHDVFCFADWIADMSLTHWFMYRFSNPHFKGIYGPDVKHLGNTDAMLPTLHFLVDLVSDLISKFLPVLK